jgi:hypothetical protein
LLSREKSGSLHWNCGDDLKLPVPGESLADWDGTQCDSSHKAPELAITKVDNLATFDLAPGNRVIPITVNRAFPCNLDINLPMMMVTA